ncbi:MAG TPA: alanine racemase, partial [Anaerolineales bacterium]
MTHHNRENLSYPPVGTFKSQLPTPALIIDLQAIEYNLATMGGFFQSRKARLRPHFKTHKCLEIALRQMKFGAIGITCAKLGEAEVLVNAGIPSVLIANQVIDPAKIKYLADLARDCQLIVAVDRLDNLERISKAAIEMGSTVHVVIEIDVGMRRAGVQPGVEALSLSEEASRLPGVHFLGLLGYEGFTMFEVDRDKRQEKARTAMEALVGTSELIQRAGIPVDMVSAGGTGTFDITGDFDGVTEVEAGSYVFMDTRYNQLGLPFKQALTLLAMVTSGNRPGRFMIDAGM